jgi:hypothetical protein
MKKKVLFFVLSAIMLAFLVGCGGSGNGSSSTVRETIKLFARMIW